MKKDFEIYRDDLAEKAIAIKDTMPTNFDSDMETKSFLKKRGKESAKLFLQNKRQEKAYGDARTLNIQRIKEELNKKNDIHLTEDVFEWTESLKNKQDINNDTNTKIERDPEYDKRIEIYREVFADLIRIVQMPHMIACIGKDYIIFDTALYGRAVYLLPLTEEINDLKNIDEKFVNDLLSKFTKGNKKLNIKNLLSHGADSAQHPDHTLAESTFLEKFAQRLQRLFLKKINRTAIGSNQSNTNSNVINTPTNTPETWLNNDILALNSIVEDIKTEQGIDLFEDPYFAELVKNKGFDGSKYQGDILEVCINTLNKMKEQNKAEREAYVAGRLEDEHMVEDKENKTIFKIVNQLSGILYNLSKNNSIGKTDLNYLYDFKIDPTWSTKTKEIVEKKLLEISTKAEGKRRAEITKEQINKILEEMLQ